jgi:Polyketide cyclase / dehydrase and lipid transport
MRITASVDIDRPASQVWAYVADYGNDTSWRGGVTEMRPSPTPHAAAALVLLLAATTLAIYKPRGVTRYGQRKQHRQRTLLVP